MASKPTGRVKVEGSKRLRRDLKRATGSLDDMKAVNASVASYVAGVAARATPTGQTGRLKTTVRGNRAASKAVVMAGRASVPYAIYVHWGTKRQESRPWVAESAQQTEPRWVAMYQAETQRIADRVRGA